MLSLLLTLPTVFCVAFPQAEIDPLATIRADWDIDYLYLGKRRERIMESARANLVLTYIPRNVSEIYAKEGTGTITYLCGVNNTFGRFPVKQHMDIGDVGDRNYAALDVVGDGLGAITHKDGSSVALQAVLHGVDDPVNPNKNGRWFAFSLSPVTSAKPGKLTGATYGFRDLVKGGRIPRSCATVGEETTFSIIATYHLFR